MNVVFKLEGFLSWEHVWLKVCDQFFMAHPVEPRAKVNNCSLFRPFNRCTIHHHISGGCKTARSQSLRSEKKPMKNVSKEILTIEKKSWATFFLDFELWQPTVFQPFGLQWWMVYHLKVSNERVTALIRYFIFVQSIPTFYSTYLVCVCKLFFSTVFHKTIAD